jgi:hypothetical protein
MYRGEQHKDNSQDIDKLRIKVSYRQIAWGKSACGAYAEGVGYGIEKRHSREQITHEG